MVFRVLIVWLLGTISLLAACTSASPTLPPLAALPAASPSATARPTAREIVFYDWAEYMPLSILTEFTARYGIQVRYVGYGSQEEAVENIRAGQVYDVVVMGHSLLPILAAEGRLAELNYAHLPNFQNVSANFRDLIFDPGNRHSVMLYWGTTGLVSRTDRVQPPVTRWADLWDERYRGQVAIYPLQRDVISIALMSLGYSVNTEDPQHLEAALQRLLALKANGALLVPLEEPSVAPRLVSGEVVLAYGWAFDALEALSQHSPVTYTIPAEGTLLWSDNLIIPANSPHPYEAELFINFMLEPEISARIVNELYYATPNAAAYAHIDPAILRNPIIFPPDEALKKAQIALPLSPAGEKLYNAIWQRFLTGGP